MKSFINKLLTLSRRKSGAAFLCGLISLLSATNAEALIVDLSDIAHGSAQRVGSGNFSYLEPHLDGAETVSHNGAITNPDFIVDIQAVYEFSLPSELSGSELTASTLTLRIVGDQATRSIELLGYSGDGTFSVSDIVDNQPATVVDTKVVDFTGGTANITVVFDVENFMQDLADASATHAGFLLRERPAPTNPVNPSFMAVHTGATPDGPALNIDFLPGSVMVQIDIHPGSDPNSINLCSDGSTPVAIFGSANLDVAQIDETTLTLADTAVRVAGRSGKFLCHPPEDINGDQLPDLVCQFYTTNLALAANVDTSAEMNGNLLDGTAIQGVDSVNLVKDCP
jgi:hypothetical protein